MYLVVYEQRDALRAVQLKRSCVHNSFLAIYAPSDSYQ